MMSSANTENDLVRRIEEQRRRTQRSLNDLIASINEVIRIGKDLIAENANLKARINTLEKSIDGERRNKTDTVKWGPWDEANKLRDGGGH